MSLIYFRVGKVPSVGIGALIYGGLSHIVSYSVFGKNGTQDVSKGRNGLFQNLNLFSFNLFPHSNFLEMLDLCNLCV